MPGEARIGDPKPVQLYHRYAEMIRSGRLPPGASLTVSRMAAEERVQRRTALLALHLLADDGLVEVRHGRNGTVVTGPRQG